MDIETDELLTLLSERVKAEHQRTTEIQWVFKQQEYLLETVREFFGEIAQRIEGLEAKIEDLEATILSQDQRRRSLRRQLIQERTNLNHLGEERARRGDEISIRLENQIEETEKRILKIQMELDRMIGTSELNQP